MRNVKLIEQEFLRRFPEGLNDKDWIDGSKKYKTKNILDLFSKELNKDKFDNAFENNNFNEIIGVIESAVKKSAVISVFEKIAFSNYLRKLEFKEEFLYSLYRFMFYFSRDSFQRFTEVLSIYKKEINMNPCKWPIVSYFKSYSDPEKFVFVKPTSVKRISEVLEYDIEYKSFPNYDTYENILEMLTKFRSSSELLKNENFIITQGVIYTVILAKV